MHFSFAYLQRLKTFFWKFFFASESFSDILKLPFEGYEGVIRTFKTSSSDVGTIRLRRCGDVLYA